MRKEGHPRSLPGYTWKMGRQSWEATGKRDVWSIREEGEKRCVRFWTPPEELVTPAGGEVQQERITYRGPGVKSGHEQWWTKARKGCAGSAGAGELRGKTAEGDRQERDRVLHKLEPQKGHAVRREERLRWQLK